MSGARRGFAISREMSVRADDGGRGDAPGEKSAIAATDAQVEAIEEEMRAVGQKIEDVEEEIRAVIAGDQEEIRAVEAALSGGLPYLGISDRDLLFDILRDIYKRAEKKEERLRDDEEQLRKKERQLREEKLRSLSTSGTQAYAVRQT